MCETRTDQQVAQIHVSWMKMIIVMLLNHEIEAVVSFSGYSDMVFRKRKGKKIEPDSLYRMDCMTPDPCIVVLWSSCVSPFVKMVVIESPFHNFEMITAKHPILYCRAKFVPVFYVRN
jgi:hypothetical protein